MYVSVCRHIEQTHTQSLTSGLSLTPRHGAWESAQVLYRHIDEDHHVTNYVVSVEEFVPYSIKIKGLFKPQNSSTNYLV